MRYDRELVENAVKETLVILAA